MTEVPRENPLPAARPPARARRSARWLFFVLFGLCLPLSWPWALLALAFFAAWTRHVRFLAAAGWFATSVAIVALTPGLPAKAGLLLAGVAFIRLLWNQNRPRATRDWADDQARLPGIRFSGDGSRVEIGNFRDARPRAGSDPDVVWRPETVVLADVRTADYVLVPFASWRGIAHAFLTFGLADGRHLAISIEARRERCESYSPLRGIFRNYEVCHIIGEERDLLGTRANIKGDPVYLYPLRVPPETARVLLERILREAARLAESPEFYNTLTNTCTRAIAIPASTLGPRPIRLLDPRIVFPGYSDALLLKLGLIDTSLSLDETRRRALINSRAAWHDDPRAWSRQIRLGNP